MTWLKEENACVLDSAALSSLLEYHQRNEFEALKLYGHHKNIMIVFITAVFAGSAALLTTSTQALLWMPLFVPALVSTACYFAAKSLDRYYQRFLEAIVATRKIEYMIGGYRHVWPKEIPPRFRELVQNGNYPYKDDRTIDVDRHSRSWIGNKNGRSSEWIEQYMSRGHNKVTEQFLRALFLFSLLAPFAALLRVVNLQPTSCMEQFWQSLAANWPFTALVVLSMLLSAWLHLRQRCWITQGRTKNQELSEREEPNHANSADAKSRAAD